MARSRRKKKIQIADTPQADPNIISVMQQARDLVPGEIVRASKTPAGSKASKKDVIIRPTSVCWGIPMDEILFAKFMSNHFRLGFMPWDNTATTESTYLPDARNSIHQQYVTLMESPYLFMLDSDVLPPPNTLMQLLMHDLPMVGGWYKGKKKPYNPIVYDFDHTGDDGIDVYEKRFKPGKGLEKVDGAGAGCWLIRRDVAEALGERPYDMNSGGEDLKLCSQVRKLGYPIHIDWDIECAHAGVTYF